MAITFKEASFNKIAYQSGGKIMGPYILLF